MELRFTLVAFSVAREEGNGTFSLWIYCRIELNANTGHAKVPQTKMAIAPSNFDWMEAVEVKEALD